MSLRRPKPIRWLGSSFRDFGRLPVEAREEIGIQLLRVQKEIQPLDWKPMITIGVGVKEIRIRNRNNIFRVFYLAKYSDLVYVLHVFQKKSQKTNIRDIHIAKRRFKSIVTERRQGTF